MSEHPHVQPNMRWPSWQSSWLSTHFEFGERFIIWKKPGANDLQRPQKYRL